MPAGGGGGGGAPTFGGGDNSLFFDDWSSYSANTDLTNGSGLHTYTARLNARMSIETTGLMPPGQSKKLRFDYNANGQDILLDCELAPPNSGAGTVVVYQFYWRQLGTTPNTNYTGKLLEMLQDSDQRLLMHISSSPPYPNGEASGGSQGESTSIATTYWDNLDPFTALNGDTPNGFVYTPTLNRDDVGLPGGLGYAYKVMQGENTFGDFRTTVSDNAWRLFSLKVTKGPEYGRDSYEFWIDNLKCSEYLGNNAAREEFDKVYMVDQAAEIIANLHIGGPSNEVGVGPFNVVEYGPIRVWRPAGT